MYIISQLTVEIWLKIGVHIHTYTREQKSCVLPYIAIVLGLESYGILLPKNILAEQMLADLLLCIANQLG